MNRSIKMTVVWTLVAANVALAGTLLWRGTSNVANAQAPTAAPLSRGKYTLIPGEASGASSIIYVFDAANDRVGAIAPDARDTLVSMPTIRLREIFDRVLEQQPGGNNRGNTPANPRPRR